MPDKFGNRTQEEEAAYQRYLAQGHADKVAREKAAEECVKIQKDRMEGKRF